jgi:phosphotransferase system HPr-like phosphotransfer protein
MKTLQVKIKNDVANIKEFVILATACPAEIDLVTGRYQVDGKSIMGIFSLDLDKPIQLCYYENAECSEEESEKEFEEFKESIKAYVVDSNVSGM